MVERSFVLGLIYKTRHIRKMVNIVFTYPYMDIGIYIYCNRENSQSPFLDKHSLYTHSNQITLFRVHYIYCIVYRYTFVYLLEFSTRGWYVYIISLKVYLVKPLFDYKK